MKSTYFGAGGLYAPLKKSTASGDDPEPNYHLVPAVLLRRLEVARKSAKAETILVSQTGKPWSSSRALSQAIRKHLIKVGLAAKGRKTISMHGLRHSAASEAATL